MIYKFIPPAIDEGDPKAIFRWLCNELREVEAAISNLEIERVRFTTLHSAPPKPRTGDVVYADGTNWDPGSGEGLYHYTSGGNWTKL